MDETRIKLLQFELLRLKNILDQLNISAHELISKIEALIND